MGTFSIWHWLIVLVVVLVLFGGKGKISGIMGDFGRGLKSFKKNIKDDATSTDGDEAPKISEKSEAAEAVDVAPGSKDKSAKS